MFHRDLAACILLTCILGAAGPPQEGIPVFGTTVFASSGLRGDIYDLKPGTDYLPRFRKLRPVGAVYTRSLNVPPQTFTLGFPGVTHRFEWFAIDYSGRIWIDPPGTYRFALTSDDGSKLYIDKHTVIDNDGLHPPETVFKKVKLKSGAHDIRISYFQGPRYQVALVLYVWRPGDTGFRVFDSDDFQPPLSGDLSKIQKSERSKSSHSRR
ncbi:MAG: hypothetical protein JOZ62_18720 [Acidobacteriaceae bacterium]|nr:hypothetical protein [Acidobacteriaceae bacterium]